MLTQQNTQYLNLLEPNRLITHFITHSPQGFVTQLSGDGIPYFLTDFDLLTTLELPLRKRLQRLPFYSNWKKLFYFKTCFIGTTVTEYSPLSASIAPRNFYQWVVEHCINNQSLTIIKDLPSNSILLDKKSNQYSQQLMQECVTHNFIKIAGQALAYVTIDFETIEQYISRFSSGRRRDFRRKLKARQHLKVKILDTGDQCFYDKDFLENCYQLYLAVYAQSEIHFDLLSKEFFVQLLQDNQGGGKVLCYFYQEQLVGYNLCYLYHDYLVDKYIGLDYSLAKKYNLYFISWFENLAYAVKLGAKYYVAGWSDPEIKAYLGAKFTFTHHLVWIKNPILRWILSFFSHYFESDYQWSKQQN